MAELLNNRYRILQTLGRGGCGETFLAEDAQMPSRRRCVIKQFRPATNNAAARQIIQERFEREAAILETLGASHDQIPALHAYFIEGGEFYLVQDWIEGQSLTQRVQTKGVCSESEVRNLLVKLLPVLEYVHAQRIIHRDIKPENIMLRERDGQPVLIDFGAVKEVVATIVDGYGSPTSSVVIGSPVYMPLEQAAGKPVFASDLYSLGLTAIYLLTGHRPQDMSDLESGEVVWRKHAPPVSKELAALLDKATRPYAQERYRTAREMLTALQPADDATDVTAVAQSAPPKDNHPHRAPKPTAPPPVSDAPHRISIPLTPQSSEAPISSLDSTSHRNSILFASAQASPEVKDAKPWALAVASLYLLALVALTWPVLKIAFWPVQKPAMPPPEPTNAAAVFLLWPYWVFVAILILCQVALLKVPVGIANRRPVTHRSLLLPIIVTGLMIGLLVIGAIFSLYEFIYQETAIGNLFAGLGVGGITWGLWIVVFYFASQESQDKSPSDVISQQCRSMLKGSILELLIAVPTHIVARSRDYCCAGVMTFVGITLGIAVMLLSFGPGVFFLFQERWNRLHKYRLLADDMPHGDEPLQR